MTLLFTHTRRALFLCLAILLALLPVQRAQAGADHDHAAEQEHQDEKGHSHAHGDENEEDEHRTSVRMSSTFAAKAGVTTAIAAAGELVQTRLLYGRLQADPRQISQVQARFPGPIVRLHRTLGDKVQAGDVVAEVEANESLRRYSLTAPISGTVVAVNASAGEFAGDQPLLTIANHDRLWAEFRLYAGEQAGVKPGQAVRIRHSEHALESRVERVLPGAGNEPYLRALAPVANVDSQWVPGQLVEADLVLSASTVPLLVDNRALQQVEENTVVFVQREEVYEIRPLQLGRSDGRFTEVLGGLNAGDRYVVGNSYLLKADLEKSGAAHVH
ncbi:MAG TPA: efflux RND transporter periplasmic adaptor subunit [Dongiaceae bacterium]|nr:efflux RND transporter periplasmic adaptor subunit [Dongiaceae bacterium]